LKVKATPGSTAILKLISPLLNNEILQNYGNTTELKLKVEFRKCSSGEILNGNSCDICPERYYSL